MDKNTLSLSLVAANSSDAKEILNWFESEKQIKDWGGPAMYYPISDISFIERLNLNELDSFKVVQAGSKDKLLAFGQFYVRSGRHHLGRLAVLPDSRGNGIGRFLVNALINKAHDHQKAQGESLFVVADNRAAIALYESFGFELVDYPQTLPNGFKDCLYMIRGG